LVVYDCTHNSMLKVVIYLRILNQSFKLLVMKKISSLFLVAFSLYLSSCSNNESTIADTQTASAEQTIGQSGVQDDASQKNVVQVAIGSKDHTTLVTAVKAGELVDALSNAGPFTVFAPTNDAFNKLPTGTVEGLLKPESKDALVDILQYHVSVGVYKTEMMQDGQNIGQVNGGNVKITKKDGAFYVNGNAKILASIPAANGFVHVIDAVLLPPKN
jgi:uncharacterized surface protein with fasciclin (FAS1) repeats